jgi:hypothetical protein
VMVIVVTVTVMVMVVIVVVVVMMLVVVQWTSYYIGLSHSICFINQALLLFSVAFSQTSVVGEQ